MSDDAVYPLRLDLLEGGRLPLLTAAYLRGEHRDLLDPLRFLEPGTLPATTEPARRDRRELADALATANAAYGHPRADQLAARLADPATRVVVTGQQPGLLGGPLLTLNKMLAAVRYAEELDAAGRPAVAVFWVATEDHDWDEVARAALLAQDGELHRLDLGPDPSPLSPVGMRTFGPELEPLLERAEALYPSPLAADAWREARRWYRPATRFGEAFCRYLIALVGERAPLLLDSMDAGVKRLQRPHLRRLIERRAELETLQREADAAIETRGLPLQVSPQPGLSPLFLLHGRERRRIVWAGDDGYALRGDDDAGGPVTELLRTVDENPAVISPGVLARPAIQDALLGTTLQILGPSELAYMAQVVPAYRVLEIEAPTVALRPQALILERKQVAQLEELGVTLEDLFDVPLDRLLAERLGGDFVTPARSEVGRLLAGLGDPVRELDPTLERPLEKTIGQIDRALDTFADKVAAAVARRNDVQRRRLERIAATARPGGMPQARLLTVAHFLARHGPVVVERLLAELELDPRTLRAVVL